MTPFLNKKLNLICLIFLTFALIMAIFAPVFTTYSFEQQSISEALEGPSFKHWFGTDNLGRDLYSRIVYGARMSLAIGIITALFSLFLGTIVGAIAGYYSGWIDHALVRTVDLFNMFPTLLMATLLTLIFGRGPLGIFVALAMATWIAQARLVRGMVLQAKMNPYVEAARAVGNSHFRIVFKHILPNLWGPIVVTLMIQIPSNIMAESFLSFVGLGIRPPYSSWGSLANEGFRALQSYPHLILAPGLALFTTMLAFNTLGDGLRDALDPKDLSSYGVRE